MIIIQVFVSVKSEFLEAFRAATLDNVLHSLQEPGIARFDLLQHADDPTQFTLIEVYRSAEAPGLHKETAHYARWRDTVEPMMAQPRRSTKYNALHYPT